MWQMRKRQLQELEEFMKFKEAVRIAKIAISGSRAATEMLKYGVRHTVVGSIVIDNIKMEHNHVHVKAARKLFNECDKIDRSSRRTFWEKRNRMLSSKKWLLNNTGRDFSMMGRRWLANSIQYGLLCDGRVEILASVGWRAIEQRIFCCGGSILRRDRETWGQTAMKFEHEELQLSQGQNELPFSRANLCRTVSY